jgi:hypothetical protein
LTAYDARCRRLCVQRPFVNSWKSFRRTGTFCSADPLAGTPDDPQSWNGYAYGRNDPIDVTDPSGKSWLSFLVDVGIGITVALLPEVAPTLFGGSAVIADESALTVSTSEGEVIGIHLGYTTTVTAATSNWTAALTAGALGGALAGKPPLAPFNQSDRNTVEEALKEANKLTDRKDCDHALQDKGVPSLKGLVQNYRPSGSDANIFDARTSSMAYGDYPSVHAWAQAHQQ